MAKYHLNPETGEAGVCRALAGNCPFSAGSEHYSSVEEARASYEAIMEGKREKPLSWLLSQKGAPLRGPEGSRALAQALHSEYEALKSRLSPLQRDELLNYTQFGFERVNPRLRGQELTASAFMSYEQTLERTKEQIEVLDSVFEQATPSRRVVYRFMAAPEGGSVKEAVEGLREAGEFHDPAFLSTSASVDYPLYEVLENPEKKLYLMELATTEGIAIQPKDHHQPGHVQSMENEVLLPRGLRFEVAGVELRKRVAFGGMKSALLEHANIWSRRDRWRMEEKPYHSVPLVKLVQK